jgi:hypothetical protein
MQIRSVVLGHGLQAVQLMGLTIDKHHPLPLVLGISG